MNSNTSAIATEPERPSGSGESIDTALLRGFLKRALADDALADHVNDLLFEHVVGGRDHPSVVAEELSRQIGEVLLTARREDWQAVADDLIAEARELEGAERGEDEAPPSHTTEPSTAPAGRAPLRFIDHRRQRYADTAPIAEAGEFIIGSYREDGSLDEDGEFKVALFSLGGHDRDRWALTPHVEAFGDGAGSLRRAIAAGLLDALGPVADNEEFSRRLLEIGIADGSDEPLSARPDDPRQARRR